MKVIVTAHNPDEDDKAKLLEFGMNALMEQYMAQALQPPKVIWCGLDFFRESMRSSKHITRMRDWSRCRSRKVRTWKGRRFSFMVDDAWMADRGSL